MGKREVVAAVLTGCFMALASVPVRAQNLAQLEVYSLGADGAWQLDSLWNGPDTATEVRQINAVAGVCGGMKRNPGMNDRELSRKAGAIEESAKGIAGKVRPEQPDHNIKFFECATSYDVDGSANVEVNITTPLLKLRYHRKDPVADPVDKGSLSLDYDTQTATAKDEAGNTLSVRAF